MILKLSRFDTSGIVGGNCYFNGFRALCGKACCACILLNNGVCSCRKLIHVKVKVLIDVFQRKGCCIGSAVCITGIMVQRSASGIACFDVLVCGVSNQKLRVDKHTGFNRVFQIGIISRFELLLYPKRTGSLRFNIEIGKYRIGKVACTLVNDFLYFRVEMTVGDDIVVFTAGGSSCFDADITGDRFR